MDLNGRRVLVVGLAQTGLATARFLKQKGSIVSATEIRPKGEYERRAGPSHGRKGDSSGMGWPPRRNLLRQDLIVMSPGVDLATEPIQKALKKGARIISDIEPALPFHSRSDDCGDGVRMARPPRRS